MSPAQGTELILGVDLGTTFSAMAVVDRHGKPVIVPNADGNATTPSVLFFTSEDECVVGEEAVKMVVVDPLNVVRFIKRAMGDPDVELEFYGRAYRPQELSALILKRLKQDAEEALGRTVKDAVITVPAYFNASQRGATAEAGRLAGLNVLSVLNEPTAAALAHGVANAPTDGHLLVFDLGGGTFDVTVMRVEEGTFRTLASDGNAELGGKDWDDRLVSHVCDAFQEAHGQDMDPRDDPQAFQEVYERCLAAKIALSTQDQATVLVTYQGRRLAQRVSRATFEAITADLLAQCEVTVQLVLEAAGLDWSRMDQILLVGGSTRMPMVRDMLGRLSGATPRLALNPDEAVALGAAVAGQVRHRVEDAPPVRIVDASTHPLGIVVLDTELNERVVTLIPAGTPLPHERRGRFAYAFDGMTSVRVEVTEGRGKSRDEVAVVAAVVLDDLPPRPRGTPIDVVYRYTAEQNLEVDITDVETGRQRRARIDVRGSVGSRLAEAATELRGVAVR